MNHEFRAVEPALAPTPAPAKGGLALALWRANNGLPLAYIAERLGWPKADLVQAEDHAGAHRDLGEDIRARLDAAACAWRPPARGAAITVGARYARGNKDDFQSHDVIVRAYRDPDGRAVTHTQVATVSVGRTSAGRTPEWEATTGRLVEAAEAALAAFPGAFVRWNADIPEAHALRFAQWWDALGCERELACGFGV